MIRLFLKSVLLSLLLILMGCATRQTFTRANVSDPQFNVYHSNKPHELKPAYRRLMEEGRRNAVLNHMRIALNAYQFGYDSLARESLDKALLSIEAVYAGNEKARKARSLWNEEGMKDFKGEPYERAMAYYYRGLLFLEDGDYENARAAFKSGIIQDAFAEEQQMRCDFALLIFLEGLASELAGDPTIAETAYKELKKLRPDFNLSSGENVIIIVETGLSPRKVADGPGHAELKFRRGRGFRENLVELSIDGSGFVKAYPMEDIFWQASSRGGRPVDKIIQGKAHFRQTHERIGSTLTDLSSNAMIYSTSDKIDAASAVLGIFGIAQMAIAARARPHADTRYWDNLPDTVHVYLSHLPKGEHQLKVNFKDADGNIIGSSSRTIDFRVEKNKPSILWLRSPLHMS